jgi:hypothetical protein
VCGLENMPIDPDDDKELGGAPTAITSLVGTQHDREDTDRERGPTQQLRIPDIPEPEWARERITGPVSAPPVAETLMDNTYPSTTQPTPTLRQRVRALWRGVSHEFQKLPSRTRAIIVVTASVLSGLIVGLLIAPSGRSAAPASPLVLDDGLTAHAKRLSMPERDTVVHALQMNDPLAALMLLRAMSAKDHLATDPQGLALRGRLALHARDGVDALDNFEAAIAAQPTLTDEPWLPAAVVQTFTANKVARTTALLGKLPKTETLQALGNACMDWQGRVRRGATDVLKTMGGQCPDPIGAAIVDAYQADKCDSARTAVAKLLPQAEHDVRVAGALDALSRRPQVANCVAELIPRPAAPPPPTDTPK